MKLSIGTDIGGTNTCTGVVDEDGRVLHSSKFTTADYPDAPSFADALADSVKELISGFRGEDVEWLGLGIGAPNGNQQTGAIEHAPNLRMEGIVPLVELMQSRLNMPVRLTNDANAAAVGEKLFGAARDLSDFIQITLGTGLGSGVFVDGKLVGGDSGLAGEIGHISVVPDGRYCGFGRRGSLENYCSATGIRRTYFEMLAQRGGPTALDHLPIGAISSKHVGDAAAEGDPICEAAMHFTGRLLGEALASVSLVTAPSAFILFGGPVQSGSVLVDTTRQYFEEHLIPTYKGKIKILVSGLKAGDAAILGAAALVANSGQ